MRASPPKRTEKDAAEKAALKAEARFMRIQSALLHRARRAEAILVALVKAIEADDARAQRFAIRLAQRLVAEKRLAEREKGG